MPADGTVEDLVVESQAVGRSMSVRVITPPGYRPDPAVPYPVLYFLHPWGLSPRYITDKLRIHRHLWAGITRGTLPPLVIVLPTGDKSFYVNAADPPGCDWSDMLKLNEPFFRDALTLYGRYGDYLLGEVIPTVERQYAVRTDRAGRAIGGISMGGAGAAVHAFRDPAQFCAVGIHSPALFQGPPEHNGPPWIFGLDAASFAAYNPADVASCLTPHSQPRIYLDCGDRDTMLHEVERLHRTLQSRGIAHHYMVSPGGHDKTYWEPRMTEYLAFYAQDWAS